MASFHLEVKSGRKGSAADHSAYIAREGKHEHRRDLQEQGFGNLPDWATTARDLWRMADRFERANGAAYREYIIPLPAELTPATQHALVMALIWEFACGKPYQYAVHAPLSSLTGEPNPHLHLMVTDRIPDGISRAPERVFTRYNATQPEKGGWKKESGGRDRLQLRDELIAKRQRCAQLQNAALAQDGYATRVDHRTLRAQGIERPPEARLGQASIRRMSAKDKQAHIAARGAAL